MTLWLSLLALALGAMGFVLYPLRRRALDDGDALRLSSNLATFEERRAELAEDLADGRLDAASHRALLAELDRALLADVGTATPPGVKMAARPARRVLWASAVLMPLLALLFYAPWGLSFGAAEDLAFKAELEVFDAAQAALGEDPTAPEIAGLRLRLEGLEQRLRSLDAKEPDGWFLVGQRAMDLGAFAQAATAFEEVEKLTGAPSWPSSTELKPSTSRTIGASTLPPGPWSIASSLPCRTSPSCLNSWPWMPSPKPAIERRRRPFAGCWRQGSRIRRGVSFGRRPAPRSGAGGLGPCGPGRSGARGAGHCRGSHRGAGLA